jgi:hypothetical protein
MTGTINLTLSVALRNTANRFNIVSPLKIVAIFAVVASGWLAEVASL